MRCPTCLQLAWRPAHGHTCDVASPTKKPIVKVAPGAPQDQSSHHPRARNDYDEETAYESYMNPEPGFQSGRGGSANAD